VALVLASGSPRRRELLDRMGLEFEVRVPDVDETPAPAEEPADLVARLAELKARVVRDALVGRPATSVLAADTVVAIDDRILGKPVDDADAVAMLRALSGRTHEVLTAVAVAYPVDGDGTDVDADWPPDGAIAVAVERTAVTFADLGDDEIEAYVATGEPRDKAGAYGIQGRGGNLVARIVGSYDNVVGLPTHRVAELLGLR